MNESNIEVAELIPSYGVNVIIIMKNINTPNNNNIDQKFNIFICNTKLI